MTTQDEARAAAEAARLKKRWELARAIEAVHLARAEFEPELSVYEVAADMVVLAVAGERMRINSMFRHAAGVDPLKVAEVAVAAELAAARQRGGDAAAAPGEV